MNIIKQQDLEKINLPGRIIQKAIGKDGFSLSHKMTVGYAAYSPESGPMEPHQHAEETVYVVSAEDAWVRFGSQATQLGTAIPLLTGMLLHIPELEWHVFEHGKNGFVNILFIYGQVENIRPEEITGKG